MGRSKPKRDSLVNVTNPKSPGNARKSVGSVEKVTPGKAALKRSLPSSSDSEEADKDQALSDVMANGLPTSKKAKFVITNEKNLGSSEESNDDNDSAEDSDEDDDDVADDDVDEPDEEDDDSDEDESDEDEDDVEGDTSEEEDEPVKLTPKKTPIQSSAIETKKTEVPEKQESGDSLPKVHYLIPNPPNNVSGLKKLFSEYGFGVDEIEHVDVPMSIVKLSKTPSAKEVPLHKPLSIDGFPVHMAYIDGSKQTLDLFVHGNASCSLFISGIPKSVTVELLKSKLPHECKVNHFKLLDQGPKNKFTNAAFFDFSSKDVAKTALVALSQVQFGGKPIRVTYAREPSSKVQNEYGPTECLMACQLPPTVTEDQLKSLFTTAISFRLSKRGNESVCFMNFRDAASASEAFDAHKNGSIGKSKFFLRFIKPREQFESKFQIEISGVPESTTISQLLQLFPGASNASPMNKNTYSVQFPSLELLRSAVKDKKTIDGKALTIFIYGGLERNIAFLKNLPFDTNESAIRSTYSDATSIIIHKNADGSSTGTATVEFSSNSACASALSSSNYIKNRRIFVSLKRVNVSSTPTPQKKSEKHKVESIKKEKKPLQVGSDSESSEDESNSKKVVKKTVAKNVKNDEADSEEQGDESDDDENEDDDEDDDEDDEEEEEDDDEEEEESDEGSNDEEGDDGVEDSDEEMPEVEAKQFSGKKQGQNFSPKSDQIQRGRGGPHRGFNNRGGGQGFQKRGGFQNRGGFQKRGGFSRDDNEGGFQKRGGFNKRGGGDFKRRGSNERGGFRGRSGFRGRGGFRGGHKND